MDGRLSILTSKLDFLALGNWFQHHSFQSCCNVNIFKATDTKTRKTNGFAPPNHKFWEFKGANVQCVSNKDMFRDGFFSRIRLTLEELSLVKPLESFNLELSANVLQFVNLLHFVFYFFLRVAIHEFIFHIIFSLLDRIIVRIRYTLGSRSKNMWRIIYNIPPKKIKVRPGDKVNLSSFSSDHGVLEKFWFATSSVCRCFTFWVSVHWWIIVFRAKLRNCSSKLQSLL